MLLLVILIIAGISAIIRPWVGIASYYLLAILGPQYIWWWNFEGLRTSFVVAITSITGVTLGLLNKRYDLGFLLNSQNLWLALLWFCIVCSYFFGPYVDSYSSAGRRPDELFAITNTIFFFYFLSCLEINDIGKVRCLIIVFVVSAVYLAYWANQQYFTENWSQFQMGRLMGPRSIDGGSIYRDENVFSVVFVTGVPFIYCLGLELQRKWQKILLWSAIPLCWHAIFLTGSRGGLLGVGVVILFTILCSNRKFLALPLLLLFVLFYQWQAGDAMKERSATITNYEGEGSAEQRITAWKGGMGMIAEHPLTGVGLGSFITALPSFADTSPRVAHNTFIQFTAESGIGAGIAYLMVIVCFYLKSRKIYIWCRDNNEDPKSIQMSRYNNACTTSFAGLIVCSVFLSLNTQELLFVLIIMNNALFQVHLCNTPTVIAVSAQLS